MKKHPHLFIPLALASLLAFAGANIFAQEKENAPAQLVIDLKDGSRVVGTPVSDKLKAATSYAPVETPWSGMSILEFSDAGPDGALASLRNGDKIKIKIDGAKFPLKTAFGDLEIPVALLRHIRVKSAGGAMSFDGNGGQIFIQKFQDLELQNFTIMAWIKRGSAEKVSNSRHTR